MILNKHSGALLILAGVLSSQAVAQQLPANVLAAWDHDQHADLRSVLVMRNGAIVAERYYNGETADTLHDVRSAGKSITALLVGAAVDQGKIGATTDKVSRYWKAADQSAFAGVTLDSVLTMRSGLDAFDDDPATPGNEDKMDEAADPVAFTLATPMKSTPGAHYRYNSMTAYVAGLTVEHATGTDLEQFARLNLFAPLGIENWRWGRDAAGHVKGQGNLSMRTRDLGSIGQMVLDKGVYQGRRVLSAAWIEAMLAPHVDIASVDRYADRYGYFWYAKNQSVGGRQIQVFFASGNGGNKIYVIPAQHSVVVVTSSAYGKGYGQLRSENILKAVLAAGE